MCRIRMLIHTNATRANHFGCCICVWLSLRMLIYVFCAVVWRFYLTFKFNVFGAMASSVRYYAIEFWNKKLSSWVDDEKNCAGRWIRIKASHCECRVEQSIFRRTFIFLRISSNQRCIHEHHLIGYLNWCLNSASLIFVYVNFVIVGILLHATIEYLLSLFFLCSLSKFGHLNVQQQEFKCRNENNLSVI